MLIFFLFLIFFFSNSSINFDLQNNELKSFTGTNKNDLNEKLIWNLSLTFGIDTTDNYTALSVAVLLVSEINKTYDSFTVFPVIFHINNSLNQDVWCWCPPSLTYANYTINSDFNFSTSFKIHFINHPTTIEDSSGIFTVNNTGVWKLTSYLRDWPKSSYTTNFSVKNINPIEIDLLNKTQTFLVYGLVTEDQITQEKNIIPGFEISMLLPILFLKKTKRLNKNSDKNNKYFD